MQGQFKRKLLPPKSYELSWENYMFKEIEWELLEENSLNAGKKCSWDHIIHSLYHEFHCMRIQYWRDLIRRK